MSKLKLSQDSEAGTGAPAVSTSGTPSEVEGESLRMTSFVEEQTVQADRKVRLHYLKLKVES